MEYLKITNYVDELSRIKLEKLGLSTKRDNNETIGQFGSGIKFAPISALRMGIDFAFAGVDSRGEYVLKYAKQEEDGIDCIVYDYGDYQKSSSFTVDAGVLSWESAFQICREVIANAVDETKISGTEWSMSLVDVDSIVPIPGEFSVYIEARKSVLDVYHNFDKYFCFNRKPLCETNNSILYPVLGESRKIYTKGVLVDIRDEEYTLDSLFDYDLDNVDLNEERTVKSMFDVHREIANVLTQIEDYDTCKYVLNIALNEYFNYFEFVEIGDYIYKFLPKYEFENDMYKKVFDEMYPNHVIVHNNMATYNLQVSAKSKGYEPIVIDNNSAFKFLEHMGIPTYSEIGSDADKFDVDNNINSYPGLNNAIDILNTILTESIGIRERVSVVTSKIDDNLLGFVTGEGNDRRIYISKELAENFSVETILSTLVHEFHHFKYEVPDEDYRSFRNLADRTIAKLICEMWNMKGSKQIV